SLAPARFPFPRRTRTRNAAAIQFTRNGKATDSIDIAREDLPHSGRLAIIDFQHCTDTRRFPVDIELRPIEHRLQPITEWPPTAPVTLHRLTGEATVHALPQVIEENFVHQSFEAPM